ncbi:MAG TPA: HU family DNA-binding protein [Capillimicrobium sp.]|nr:HU family DNA-binding protein [Capillimicrobium sp.]
MKRDEIAREVADRCGLSREEAARAIDAILETIEETLQRGDEVSFTGFGKFHAARRAARHGVNPRTGERIEISAARVPRFSAGTRLKQSLVLPGKGGEPFGALGGSMLSRESIKPQTLPGKGGEEF